MEHFALLILLSSFVINNQSFNVSHFQRTIFCESDLSVANWE